MAKKALLDVLESTIGRYVLNLDASSLNVSVWSGKIDLGGLEVDANAVNDELSRKAHERPNLAVPLQVVRGKFDSLNVSVPWTKITSRPVVIRASGLSLVVEPYDHLAGSVDAEGRRRENVREENLALAEDRRRKMNALFQITGMDRGSNEDDDEEGKSERNGPTDASGASFTSKLVRRIVENIQVEVSDFNVSLRGPFGSCSMGVELKSMSLATTDANGVKTFVDRVAAEKGADADPVANSFLHKALGIHGLGLYCDGDMDDDDVGVHKKREGLHDYIITPLDFTASVRQSDLQNCVDFPKYRLRSALPSLSLRLTRSQLELTDRITSALVAPTFGNSRPLFPEYRPPVTLRKGTARLWWKYAVRCVGRLNRRRSWTEYFLAYKKRKRYVSLYIRHVHSSTFAASSSSSGSKSSGGGSSSTLTTSMSSTSRWSEPLTDKEREELRSTEMDQSISVEAIMLWRNVADAEAEHERERRAKLQAAREEREKQRKGSGGRRGKKDRKSVNTYTLFGSSEGGDSGGAVQLSPSELKELESATLAKFDEVITSESKLYEFEFALSSLTIDLIGSKTRLASLNMGTVRTTFDAKADGSYSFGYTLSSLEISDEVTKGSVFPLVVRSLTKGEIGEKEEEEEGQGEGKEERSEEEDGALRVRLYKSAGGDQDLKVRMAAFEVVGSPLMLLEFSAFFSLPPPQTAQHGHESGAEVASASGSISEVDSDEEEDDDKATAAVASSATPSIIDVTAKAAGAAAEALADNLALAAADAWSRKKLNKKKWMLDCVVDAPVLVVPEDCTNPSRPAIVLDLGRFSIKFGADKPSEAMKGWFDERAIESKDSTIDVCNIELRKLVCFVGDAGRMDEWREMKAASDDRLENSSARITEPLSGRIEIGIENRTTHSDAAGTCVLGVIPIVGLEVTGEQVTSIRGVADAWSSHFASSSSAGGGGEGVGNVGQVDRMDYPPSEKPISKAAAPTNRLDRMSSFANMEKFHAEVALRRLSAKLVADDDGDGRNGLEAHLVSTVASTTQLMDGESSSRLSMGWFWVLDNVARGGDAEFPREQRIIAHSQLPRPASYFAQDGKYGILGELEEQGVFGDDYAGSSDLAEVTVTMAAPTAESTAAKTVVEGKFLSLSVNYNPSAVRNILALVTSLSAPEKESSPGESQLRASAEPRQSLMSSAVAAGTEMTSRTAQEQRQETATSPSMVVHAEMKGFEVMLRSSKDDKPLFCLAMTKADATYSTSGADDMDVELRVRDVLCKDEREHSRQDPGSRFVDIIGQCDGGVSSGVRGITDGERNLLGVAYSKRRRASTVDVTIGSPQLVVVPEAVEDMLAFVRDMSQSEEQHHANNEDRERTEQIEDSLLSSAHPTAAGALVEKTMSPPETDESLSKASIGSTSLITIKAKSRPHCRLVLVDAGMATTGTLAEVIVFQGGFEAGAEMTLDDSNSSLVGGSYSISWDAVQVFTAQGRDLLRPSQILEPVGLSLAFKSRTLDNGLKQELELEALVKNKLDLMVSLENVALLQAIGTSLGDALSEGQAHEDVPSALSEEEASHLKHLVSALDKEDALSESGGGGAGEGSNGALDGTVSTSLPLSAPDDGDSVVKTSRFVKMRAAMPEMRLTLINDLQGLDNGLFKVVLKDLSADGELNDPASGKRQFKYHFSNSISSDYFDNHMNRWEPFLSKPWNNSLKAWRVPGKQDTKERKDEYMFTTIDIESDPCNISFSEQFLVSLGAAQRMWNTYNFATRKAASSVAAAHSVVNGGRGKLTGRESVKEGSSALIRKSMAAFTARSFVNTLPYALENHCGKRVSFEVKGHGERIVCPSGTTQYFRFDAPRGDGIGSKRAYGQDITRFKSLRIFVGKRQISIHHLDAEINRPRQAHHLGAGQFVFTKVVKSGRATVIFVSSNVDVYNCTSLSFDLSVLSNEKTHDIGRLEEKVSVQKKQPVHGHSPENMVALGVPVDLLSSFQNDGTPSVEVEVEAATSEERIGCDDGISSLSLQLSTGSFSDASDNTIASGTFSLPSIQALMEMGKSKKASRTSELLLSSRSESVNMTAGRYDLLVQVTFAVSLVGSGRPYIRVYLQPCTVISNQMPIDIFVSASKLYTISPSMSPDEQQSSGNGDDANAPVDSVVHSLRPNDKIEAYTPHSELKLRAKCNHTSLAGGTATTWTAPLVISLDKEKGGLQQPIAAIFPFEDEEGSQSDGVKGMPFIVSGDSREAESDDAPDAEPPDNVRVISLSACNVLVDHTGDALIEEFPLDHSKQSSRKHVKSSITDSHSTFSVFKSPRQQRWLTLLPTQGVPLRLLRLTDRGGLKRSIPFCVEDIIFCNGGAESSIILGEDGKRSGYYAYRKFSSCGLSTDIHIIPEFVVYNGSTEGNVLVKTGRDDEATLLSPGQVAPFQDADVEGDFRLSFDLVEQDGFTDPIHVDELGMKVCIVKSKDSGAVIGSLAVQTDIGKSDSRLVVKLGTFKLTEPSKALAAVENSFDKDFLRFRVRVSEIEIKLYDTQMMGEDFERNLAAVEEALNRTAPKRNQPEKGGINSGKESDQDQSNTTSGLCPVVYSTIAKIALQRLTVDYQKIFRKSDRIKGDGEDGDEERSQLAFIIRHLRVENCTPNCVYPVVLDTSRTESSFFDLCVRSRHAGKDSELIPVDMLDLNLAYQSGKADHIVLQSEEDFMWSLLDIANRTVVATSELAGVDLQLEWNEETEEYTVSLESQGASQSNSAYDTYTAPRSDTLYDIKSARVSPVKLLVSFRRQPQETRYKLIEKGRGAKLMNYFTTQLSFTIDRAELNFAGYVAKNVKGPSDRLAKMVAAVYTARLKRKAFNLITAVSVQDWHYLTARDDGVDDYVEGDVLRLTGHVAGRSAGFILKKAGQGLGGGVAALTAAIGSEIQYATEKVGIGGVGAGINSAVTGLGAGVGTAVEGVGEGGGKFVRGAGKGAGQIIGGVGGGAMLAAQGRLGEGVHAAGYGLGHGVETLVSDTAEGVHTVGTGLFGGIRKIVLGCCGPCFGAEGGSESEDSHGRCSVM